MSRSSSSARRPASRPGTARNHELTTKRRGEIAELAFTLKAASLGFGVAKPYGDSERYDFILDPRHVTNTCHRERSNPICEADRIAKSKDPVPPGATTGPNRNSHLKNACPTLRDARRVGTHPLHRIQVKCSTQLLNGLYRVNAHRRTNGRAVPYLPSEIDFLVAYIIPEDTWYVIPIHAIRVTSLLFRRRRDRRPGLYDQYREAWHLLRPTETK